VALNFFISHSHNDIYVKEIRLYQASETGIVWPSDNKKADAINISLFYSLSVALAILSKRNLLTGEGDVLFPDLNYIQPKGA
jgi:hypothetical protein